jgi:16S rRNA processing protein RimM
MSNLVLLGYVTSAFGTKGGLNIKLINEDSNTLAVDKPLILRHEKYSDLKLLVKEYLSGPRIFFAEISDRTEAEGLKGAELYIDYQDLPKTQDDEFYLQNLLDARVIDTSGASLGTVVSFSDNRAQILLIMKTNQGSLASIPLVRPIISHIDYENNVVTIDPPMGLLELGD